MSMAELHVGLPGSAETWRSGRANPLIPDQLYPSGVGSVGQRLAEWRRRHLLRERRATEFFEASRRPERGLPVAERKAVASFVGGMLSRRRLLVATLLILHALGALAGVGGAGPL